MLPKITFRDIFNSTSNGIIATDAHGIIMLINQKALRILGLKKKIVMGVDVSDVLPMTGRHILDCLKTGKPQIGRHIRGKKVNLVVNVTPVRKGGTIAGTVSNFQKMEQFEHSAQQLESYRQLNNQLESIFNSSSDGIQLADSQGNIIKVNKASEKLNDMNAKNFIGKNYAELLEKGWFDRSVVQEVLKTKRKVSILQYVAKAKKYLLITGTPVFDDEDNILLVVINERDMTQLNTIQEQLKQTRSIAEKYKEELAEMSMLELKKQEIIAKSEEMRLVLKIALKLARLNVSNILVLGESGTGKGLVAKFIHHNSKRKRKPFIQINCAALPENLLEAELFGYEKGAFTGAREEGKAGLFELAQGGTLFLDEIGDLSLSIQAKLLKYLDDNNIMRLGGTKSIVIDCTVIAATNRDVDKLVKTKKFREDLYYRLNSFTIKIPPLRERQDDIYELSMYFLEKYNKEYGVQRRITANAMEMVQSYPFPGNIRELMNVIKKAVVISEEQTLDVLIQRILSESFGSTGKIHSSPTLQKNLTDVLLGFEKEVLKSAMLQCKTTHELAGVLGISQPTAFRKLKKHGLAFNIIQ